MVVAGMQASIDERHLKDFVKLLQCASRYGDELCIHANQSRWELAVTNSNQSAFCLFKLDPQFFSRYRALGTPSERRKGIKCKLLVKSVLAVLGKPSAMSSIERLDLRIHDGDNELRAVSSSASTNSGTGSNGTPQRSDTGFGDEDDDDPINSLGSVLVIRLVCKHGITKKHTLNLASTDFVRVDIDPNSTPSSFTISARTLRNWLEHFSLTSSSVQAANNLAKMENQLGWMFGKNEVRLKSWEGVSKDLCTEIKIDVAEFGSDRDGRASYWVEQERVDLTLPMREFRATLQLADSMNIDLTVAFSLPTQPLTMIYEGGDEDNFDIFCAIATMHCDAFPVDFDKPNVGQQPQPQTKSLDPRGRRIVSDLTDDGGGERDGPGQAEGSKRRAETPAQSQGSQKRRSVSRLELTASQKQASMASVVHNSQPQSSQRGVSQHGSQHGGPVGDGETIQQERLFGPGASQEDDYAPPQSQGMKQVMTQEEVMKLAGLDGMDMESLVDEMDDAEDEEWTASQQAQVQAHHNGPIGNVDEWDNGEIIQDEGMTGDGEGFQPDDSVFDDPAFQPPASYSSQPPARRPLAERVIPPSIPPVNSSMGRYQQQETRGEGSKGKGRSVEDRPSLPNPQSRRDGQALTASRSEPGPRGTSPTKGGGKFQARVRSETEEERHSNGANSRRGSSVGRQPLGDLKMDDEEELDDSDDELGPSQAGHDIPRLFKD